MLIDVDFPAPFGPRSLHACISSYHCKHSCCVHAEYVLFVRETIWFFRFGFFEIIAMAIRLGGVRKLAICAPKALSAGNTEAHVRYRDLLRVPVLSREHFFEISQHDEVVFSRVYQKCSITLSLNVGP
jgi:hypothetical protein